MKHLLLAAAATLAATGAASAQSRDWSQSVVATPTGWRAGNPAAPLKLVEYASLNCPHCAHFSQAADAQIMARVKTGRVSFEYRPYLIFPHDVAASLVARCVPLNRRFAFIRDYYGDAEVMTDKLRAAMKDPAQEAQLKAASQNSMGTFNQKVLAITGLNTLAARYGITPVAANRCVTNQAGLDWLQKAHSAARAAGIDRTPTYQLNGQKLEVGTPEELLAKLK